MIYLIKMSSVHIMFSSPSEHVGPENPGSHKQTPSFTLHFDSFWHLQVKLQSTPYVPGGQTFPQSSLVEPGSQTQAPIS